MTTYSVGAHLDMVADTVRTSAHRVALERVIEPGCTVLDIGTGSGVLAVFAIRSGAGGVIAVEPDPVIDLARRIAEANGVADRITFVTGISTELTLPEPASVIVSDIGGVLPMFASSIASRIDARERLLAPDGVMIPARETLWAALAEVPKPHRYDSGVLEHERLDLDLSPARPYATCEWAKRHVTPEQVLSEPQRWAALDYATIDSPEVRGEVETKVRHEGEANGVVAWFDKELAEGVGFSNAPGEPETIYGQAFFPLSEQVPVKPGDRARISIEAIPAGGQYVWRWQTSIEANDGALRASFDQSSLQATPLSVSRLRRREAAHLASLGEDGEIDRFILGRFDGETPLLEIAAELQSRFPERFGRPEGHRGAFDRVAALSEQYGE